MSVINPPPTDETLITLSVDGNQQAFRRLVIRHSGLIYNFILKRVSNRELAEDLTQEVFVNVYRSLRKFDCQRSFKPWILRIASNTIISNSRKVQVRPQTVSISELQEHDSYKDWADSPLTDPQNQLERKILSESAEQAISKLEARYQETLQLRYIQELSYAEIAKIKGIPLNTVKTWVKRGKELLQEQMKGLIS